MPSPRPAPPVALPRSPRVRLALLMAVWQRPRLTRLVVDYYSRLRIDGVSLLRLAVGSPACPCGDFLRGHDRFFYVEGPNAPLGAKWNGGLAWLPHIAAAHGVNLDGVMIVGSDDLVTPAYFEIVRDRLAAGYDYVGLRDLYAYDAPAGRLARVSPGKPGAGRVISRRVLGRLGWRLWPAEAGRYLDSALHERVMTARPKVCEVPGGTGGRTGDALVLDVKTNVGMWRLDGDRLVSTTDGAELRLRSVTGLEPAPFLRRHFPGQAAALLAWNAETA